MGEQCELPSGVWGRAPAKIEFGALQLYKMRSGGNSFNYFPKNKLTKLANFVSYIHMLMFLSGKLRGPGPPGPPFPMPLDLLLLFVV